MLDAAILLIIEEAGINVLTMTEGLEESEFLATRLTRAEVGRQIGVMAGVSQKLSSETRTTLTELDWEGWDGVARQIDKGGHAGDDALWFAVSSLVPAMLMWLRIYRQNRLELFTCKPSSHGQGT